MQVARCGNTVSHIPFLTIPENESVTEVNTDSRMLFLLLMCMSESVLAKLVIRHDQVDQYNMERVKREGELVNTYTRDHPECEGVKQNVWEYRYYYVYEDGEEEESTATVYSVVDIIWDTEEIVNVEEQWIKAIIYIRSTNCLAFTN